VDLAFKVVPGSAIKGVTGYDRLLIEYGESLFKNSLPTIQDFSKQMITLVSALFAAYFPILEFLAKGSVAPFSVVQNYTPIPPIFLILSIVSFVLAILPLKITFALNFPKEIENDRIRILTLKYWAIYFGLGLLIIGLSITIWIFVLLISP
jgi:hypothetical protein